MAGTWPTYTSFCLPSSFCKPARKKEGQAGKGRKKRKETKRKTRTAEKTGTPGISLFLLLYGEPKFWESLSLSCRHAYVCLSYCLCVSMLGWAFLGRQKAGLLLLPCCSASCHILYSSIFSAPVPPTILLVHGLALQQNYPLSTYLLHASHHATEHSCVLS